MPSPQIPLYKAADYGVAYCQGCREHRGVGRVRVLIFSVVLYNHLKYVPSLQIQDNRNLLNKEIIDGPGAGDNIPNTATFQGSHPEHF